MKLFIQTIMTLSNKLWEFIYEIISPGNGKKSYPNPTDQDWIKDHWKVTLNNFENPARGSLIFDFLIYEKVYVTPSEVEVMNYNIAEQIATVTESYACIKIHYFFRQSEFIEFLKCTDKTELMNKIRYMDYQTMINYYNSYIPLMPYDNRMSYKAQVIIIFDSTMIKSCKSVNVLLYDKSPLLDSIYTALEESNEKYGITSDSIKTIIINVQTPRL